jgi:hypothetical protein
MAFNNSVIFLESMADIIANPVDNCFGSMLAKSTAPAGRLVIESNAVTSNQQIGRNLLTETHPPTPSDLIEGIDRVEACSPTRSKSANASNALAGPHHHPAYLLARGTQLM